MSAHENIDRRLILGAASLAGVAGIARLAKAGPLDPPSGPVTPTGKPLAEIEPRVAVNDSNTPGSQARYALVAGSYYLTGNVTVDSGMAIMLMEDHITLDLNGFTLSGPGAAGAGIGVFNSTFGRGGVIRNGIIRNFGRAVTLHDESVVEDVTFINNGTPAGFGMLVGWRSVLRRCRFIGGTGLRIASGSVGDTRSVLVEDCSFMNIGGAPIIASDTSGFTLRRTIFSRCGAPASLGYGSQVADCSIEETTTHALNVGASSTIERVSAVSNAGDGIVVGDGSSVFDCNAINNTGRGIVAGNGCHIARCTTRNNQLDGITVNYASTVRDCSCNGDGAAAGDQGAIRVLGESNRIDSNHISYAQIGIYLQAPGNTVIRNSLRGNQMPVNAVAGNDLAPFTTAATATSPWGNILS